MNRRSLALIISLMLLFSFVSTQLFKTQISIPKPKSRHDLKHSQILLTPPIHLRHQLSSTNSRYVEAPLASNHISFQLQMLINGLKYKLNVDTGSSDFWAKGEGAAGQPKKQYKCNCDYKDGSVYTQYQLSYLDGTISLYEKELDVFFNGKKFDANMLVAYSLPSTFDDVEGIVGLSYAFQANHHPTFIEILIDQKIIDNYAYGFNFNLIQDNRSFINFGKPDQALYQGKLTMYPLISQQSIKIRFKYLTIGNSQNLSCSYALIDTGNTCISIPKKYQDTILSYFNTASNKCKFFDEDGVEEFKLLQCKVKNFDELPKIAFRIGREYYEITHEYYLQFCLWRNGYDYCSTYIETVDVWWESSTVFLGDGFLNRFYTYVDLQEKKVGIAKNKENITMDDVLEIYPGEFVEEDWQGL